jgi:predicted transcriptional regulator
MKNKRGYHFVVKKQKLKKRILNYSIKYPDRSKMECSKALGVSWRTVYNHWKELESEGLV